MGLKSNGDHHAENGANMENIDLSRSVVVHRKEKPKMAETWPEMLKAWPKTTLCIVSNEFCERFSYYGMRTILLLYFLNVLKFDYSIATVGTNGFTVLCYLTPLFGSIIADGYVGKFKTIFVLSIVYALGQLGLAAASTLSSSSPCIPM
uniref:Uncharacterized protein n=2 Tax=Ditylenchus dipsaci TaxID=166011 RepID=A0A915CP76_9BILA